MHLRAAAPRAAVLVVLGLVGCEAEVSQPPLESPRPAADNLDPSFAAALSAAEAAIRERPESAATHGAMGRLLHAHRYLELAERAYRNAARLDPAAAVWPYYLGILALEDGDLQDAADAFERARRLDPAYATAHYRLGVTRLGLGDLDAAQEAFDSMSRLAAGSAWATLGLARVAYRRRRLDEAGRLARAALEQQPSREAAHLLLSIEREGGGDDLERLAEAVQQAPEAQVPDPWLVEALQRHDLQAAILRANRLLAGGDARAAETIYDQVLSQDPRHYEAHFNLGVLCGRQGRFAEAATHLEAARAARPDSTEARLWLSMAYLSGGDPEKAETELLALQAIAPGDARARGLLEELRRRPGR